MISAERKTGAERDASPDEGTQPNRLNLTNTYASKAKANKPLKARVHDPNERVI